MTRIRAFQILVSVSVLLYLTWMALPHLPRAHSVEVQNILDWGSYGAEPWVLDPRFYLAIGVSKLMASLGLVLFLSWGRWLYLAVVVIGLTSVPFAGVSIGAPLDNLVGWLATLIDGSILTLAFASPIAEATRKDG